MFLEGNEMEKRILAVELPAPCPLACGFCRTPEHGVGDAEAVFEAVKSHLASGGYDEVYYTGNGEPGLSSIFAPLVELAGQFGVPVAVLCATKKSIVPGLVRAEISINNDTASSARGAMAAAKEMGVPIVVSMVDDGSNTLDLERVAAEHGAVGVIVRALQKEGRSENSAGTTRIFQRVGEFIGLFPAAAYAELRGLANGFAVTCIGPVGKEVDLLGGAAA